MLAPNAEGTRAEQLLWLFGPAKKEIVALVRSMAGTATTLRRVADYGFVGLTDEERAALLKAASVLECAASRTRKRAKNAR